jgi:hypothetical protein
MKNIRNIFAVLLSGSLFACVGAGGYVAYPVGQADVVTSYSTDAYFPQPAVYSYSSTSYNTSYNPSPVIIRTNPRPFYTYSNTERPFRSPYRRQQMNFPVTNDNQRDIWVPNKQFNNGKPNMQQPMPQQRPPQQNQPSFNNGQRNGQVMPPSGNNQNRPAGQQPGNSGNKGNIGNNGNLGNSGKGNSGNTGNFGNSGNTGNSGNSGNSGNTGNSGNSNKGNNGVHNGITQGNGSNGQGNAGGQTRLPPGQAKK